MKNPYELAKNILQSSDQKEQPASSNSFTSIDLYGAAVHEKGEEEENCSSFHLENESVSGISRYIMYSRGLSWCIMICIWHIATRIRNRRTVCWRSTTAEKDGQSVCLESISTAICLPEICRSAFCRIRHTSRNFRRHIIMGSR